MRGIVVAMDLETTGLNPDFDHIIEIGAVRMQDDEIIGEFQTFIYPGIPIPQRVTSLTGIADADVSDAPRLSTVLPNLKRFIGDATLLGHNIGFDIEFLERAGLRLPNPSVDTYVIASALLPNAPRYNLTALSSQLGESLEEAHRAYHDALASYRVYRHLWNRVLNLPINVLFEIVEAGQQMPWGGELVFEAALAEGARTMHTERPDPEQIDLDEHTAELFSEYFEDTEPRLNPDKQLQRIDIDDVAAVLEPGGDLAEALENYEYRPQQVDMVRAVSTALNEGRHTLIEAPTGVGKSMGYLVPALHFALENDDRVVVSTNTINLQEQLIRKDIPLLQKELGLPFRAAVLKGRSNYLCPRRLVALRRRVPTSAIEMQMLAKILIWLTENDSGDRGELTLRGPVERSVWRRLSAEDEGCTLGRCASQMMGACPFYQARRAAESAHILIVNHALLLSDAASEGHILPPYKYLIIDEAHHLEDAVTNSLSFRTDPYTISRQLAELGTPQSGLLGDLLRQCEGVIPDRYYQIVRDFVELISSASAAMGQHVEGYFTVLATFLEENARVNRSSGYTQSVRIVPAMRSSRDWSQIERYWDNLNNFTSSIASAMTELAQGLTELQEYDIYGYDDLFNATSSAARHLTELDQRLNEVTLSPDANTIYWAEFRPDGSAISLHAAPLDVGPLVQQHLWHEKEAVIMASATLRTAGTFNFIKDRLNAEDADEVVIESPFDYAENTLLYLVNDIPEPSDHAAYQHVVEEGLIDLCLAVQGRTMVLFTSYSQLRQTAGALSDPLAHAGITLFDQSDGSSRTQLLDSFVDSEKAVLMGTRSFWEGVDVPGADLSVLVIAKLPFNVPTDPLYAARSELFTNSFTEYAVPETILRFRQGFGRLIRRSDDRGIVAVFDRRVLTKTYGHLFLESLPECTVHTGRMAELPQAAVNWLEKG